MLPLAPSYSTFRGRRMRGHAASGGISNTPPKASFEAVLSCLLGDRRRFQGRRSKPEAEHHVQPLETLESVATLSFLFHQSPLLNSRLSDGVLTSAVTIVAATVLADSDQRATSPADCLQLL